MDVIDLREVDNLVVADGVLIVVLFGNADCVQEVEVFAYFQFFLGDLSEFLVLQGHLYAVVDIGPRERIVKIDINTSQGQR